MYTVACGIYTGGDRMGFISVKEASEKMEHYRTGRTAVLLPWACSRGLYYREETWNIPKITQRKPGRKPRQRQSVPEDLLRETEVLEEVNMPSREASTIRCRSSLHTIPTTFEGSRLTHEQTRFIFEDQYDRSTGWLRECGRYPGDGGSFPLYGPDDRSDAETYHHGDCAHQLYLLLKKRSCGRQKELVCSW